jgi:hypothetical protein
MKTSELTRAALDWAVAKCVYPDLVWGSSIGVHHASHQIVIPHLPEPECYWNPSSNWAQGGPIIERLNGHHLKIWLESSPKTKCEARINNYEGNWVAFGPTPLIAAMRCYVASKLGDEIEIPTELGESK